MLAPLHDSGAGIGSRHLFGGGWRLRYLQAMTQPITVNSRWIRKHVAIEVTVTRVTESTVSYIAVDCSISGTVAQWLFL